MKSIICIKFYLDINVMYLHPVINVYTVYPT